MPNLLKIIYGKGSMILCANPLIFTNFNLLEGKHASYIGNVLSELPVQKVVWDEYTNSGPVGLESANTPIRFILSKPALRNAYYLLMLILILFIVFKSKRRQSTIPVVEPPKNSTKLFVETIGRLYFNKSNPKNMGQKKARFFLSFISKKLNINTQKRDAQFLNHLHIASGLSMNLIKDLNKGIERALNPNEFFSATDLVELTENINTFKHKTK